MTAAGRDALGELSDSAVASRNLSISTTILGSDLDTAEGRSFLQQRLALFARTMLVLSSIFLAVDASVLLFSGWRTWASWDRELWHLLALLVALGGWLLTRRGEWSLRSLVTFDLGITLLSLVGYGLMSITSPGEHAARVDLVMALVSIVLLMFRAVVVPGSPSYTGTVSALGMLPAIGVTHYIAVEYAGRAALPPAPLADLFALIWTVAVVVMTTLISRTVYHLRARVREAQRLGQYLLGEKIGEGGMGAVYRAHHALLRRPTALKLILPERVGKQALARFEREVQLTALLTHPNTVSIFDYGHTPDGIFYYAMEYLDGVDLEQLVKDFGPLPPERVVHVLVQVAGALAEAHEVGLVHRDVKPANIILCQRGRLYDTAKIVDFGLVKDLRKLGEPGLSQVDSVIGTPLYLAPEALISPDKVDARADIYALGAVAYYLLTGTPVFAGTTAMEVCAQHLHNAPESPSLRVGRHFPERLEHLLLQCLAKKPEERPQSAAELGEHGAELGVGPWTQAQARAWWREYGDKIVPRRAQRSSRSPVGSAVTVDVGARAVPG